jgi:hypothetical protein
MGLKMGLTFTRAPALVRIAKIKKFLEVKPMTVKALAAKLHMTATCCRPYLLHLHEQGQVHVFDWEPPAAGRCAPIYQLGPGTDKPYPPQRTHAERYRQRRAVLEADQDALDLHRARQAAWHYGRKKPRHPFATWLNNPVPVETHPAAPDA